MPRTRRIVVIPDTHYPLHDPSAVNVVKKVIDLVKPDEKLFLGDIGEWLSVSEWQYKRRKRPRLEDREKVIQQEINDVNSFLDSFPKTKTTTVLTGNHDRWTDYFVEEYPYSGFDKYLFRNAINIDKRKWGFYNYGEYYQLGKLYTYHGGHWTTANHTRQHILNLGVSVLYGHVHGIQRDSVAHADGYRAGFCIGCLKKLDSDSNLWLKGRKTNWGHALAIVDVESNGNFSVNVVDITAGIAHVWGHRIDGNNK